MYDGAGDDDLLRFRNAVGVKFQLYNSLFTSLPFHKIEKTGILLSLFQVFCEESFEKGKSPAEIVDSFVAQNTAYLTEQEKAGLLFRFIQYAKRQVVLFDAIEDAAFHLIHDLNGPGTLKQLASEVASRHKENELAGKLKDFAVRLVLTAHPTQFYPDEVLGIIHDLSDALKEDNVADVNIYLQQLGKTPFLKKEKPTPYDEAMSLIWYLENVFYPAAGKMVSTIASKFPAALNAHNPIIGLGFWPGGDRDGNPFVTVATTFTVAAALKKGIIKCYLIDIKKLKHRLTFKGVNKLVAELESKLFNALYYNGNEQLTTAGILLALQEIRERILNEHDSLFLFMVDELLIKVSIFGLYFASLDIRQNSSVHTETIQAVNEIVHVLPASYEALTELGKIDCLLSIGAQPDVVLNNDLFSDTISSVKAIEQLQKTNGEKGCHRYIISHTTSALNIIEVYALFRMFYAAPEIKLDITPLFEMIEDLHQAGNIMKTLYENEIYRKHLQSRGNIQHIMLGFSDGTKDGGYLAANWSIYKAKEDLTAIAVAHGIELIFFDGRGGPPARGGGKTHQFYASLGSNIAGKQIQLTIQGQTISSNFGNVGAAMYNMEQLVHAGIFNRVLAEQSATLSPQQESLMQELSQKGHASYLALKNHPHFLTYLEHISPLHFYADANIGSRPAKRNSGSSIVLDDLRAIPFVGAWSQLKQNLTGYYGVGTALAQMEDECKWEEVCTFYENSLFFRALINNCEMAMMKCYFPLTAHLAGHPVYGPVWTMIFNEYELTKKMILKLNGNEMLMQQYPVDRLSITMRERIVLPLTTIQQFAISRLNAINEHEVSDIDLKKVFEKLVMRCSFGIINAGRNSV